jgi:hypothetical protein
MAKIQDMMWLFHLTKLSNLDSIIEIGLASRKLLLEQGVLFADIADHNIMDKRKEYGLDGYVPFHFHPYSSFDVAVKNTNRGEEFIYICIERELARVNGFLILPRHPLNLDEVELLEYDDGIRAIDWTTMEASSMSSEYARQVRMAECLTNKIVPVNCFQSIAVRNDDVKSYVEQKLTAVIGNSPYVDVRPWLNI